MTQTVSTVTFPVLNYDLAGTLNSGQVFRWVPDGKGWVGVLKDRWIRLQQVPAGIRAVACEPVSEWTWLKRYLQIDMDLEKVLATFPQDPHLTRAVTACRGLRLLRQDPWECLASFILSSTKRIVQIREIIHLLCQRFGQPVCGPVDGELEFSFPTAPSLAAASESDLRACKMGFRAPYLLGAARAVSEGTIQLESVQELPLEAARTELMRLDGVGRKIADCVLLFAFGFQKAFPIDVWVLKALKQLYFPRRRRLPPAELREFAGSYFGPFAGYAQQYLFHYMRTEGKPRRSPIIP